MIGNPAMKLAVALAAAAAAGLMLGADGASEDAVVTACSPPATRDSVCRQQAVLKVRYGLPAAQTVTTNSTRIVKPKSVVILSQGGVTDVYMRLQAECQSSDVDAGTRFQTRQPNTAILTFFYGYILCSLANGSVVEADSYARLRAGGFNLANARVVPTKYRLVLEPGSVLAVAVYQGGVALTLRSGPTIRIAEGEEAVVALIGADGVGRVRTGTARFTDTERRIFESQGRRIR